jgi:sugar phosphate isomerase/epimerase
MSRPVTLFTGQWADLTLEELAQKTHEWGFDGLELACWGDHFKVDKALEDDGYVKAKRDLLEKYGQRCFAIMKNTARAARKFGVDVVNGFTGSSVWGMVYFFPPTSQADIDKGYEDFANRWLPILEVFKDEGVKFGLEVHPTEIAYDNVTARRALDVIDNHPNFGFNFDPSHFVHQFIDPVFFLDEFPDRIFHMHVKDSRVQINGRNSILSSHLDFGDPRRGWDFVSPGRGDVEWDEIIRALNRIGYNGPLSIEWEDSGMDRDWGAPEALEMIRSQDFTPSTVAFDAAFAAE